MADFLEPEAEESDDDQVPVKRNRIIDSDEEEEEDDEEQIREEMKDLINDNEEEEEEASASDSENSDDSAIGRKRKRKNSANDKLEDDDYALIEENLGIKIERKKRFSRVRIEDDDDSDAESSKDASNEKTQERDVIAQELFEGEEEGGGEVPEEAPPPAVEEDGELSASGEEYSDADDFIVDDDGQPITKTKNKKKVRYTDLALQEAQDIFGVDFDFEEFDQYGDDYEEEEDMEYEEEEGEDGEQRPTRPKKAVRKKSTKKSIFDVYEPSELERGHFTDLDNEIRTADIPERFQLRGVPVVATEEGELEEESEWIYKFAFCTPPISFQETIDLSDTADSQFSLSSNRKGPSAVSKIREALNFMRNQHFEVPFIAFYRKEYVEPELNINDLWKVYSWDEKWCQLRMRKNNLLRLFEKMQQYQFDKVSSEGDAPLGDEIRVLQAEDLDRVKKVQTMEEFSDVYAHFILYYGRDITKMQNSLKIKKKMKSEDAEEGVENVEPAVNQQDVIKQASRKDGYAICQLGGLDGMAKKYGLTPEQFGEHLRDNYQRHEIEQYPVEPLEVANDFCGRQFITPEDVLAGAKYMVAIQIAKEPLVRQCVREVYYERAQVTIRPTKKGLKEIDENNPCYAYKYLKNKPVKDLKGDQFLRAHLAAEEGLLEITISIDNETRQLFSSYLEESKQLYYRDEFSRTVQDWNTLRTQAVEMAFKHVLYPYFAKELKLKLLEESREGIIRTCSRKLYNWLKVAPYQIDQQMDDDDDYDSSNGIRVMGLAYSTERDTPAFCALIDGDGEVTDYQRLPYILLRKNAWRQQDRENKDNDLETLKKFIIEKKPHVIVIGAESRDATMISDDIKLLVSTLESENDVPTINIELMNNNLATVYMNSKKAEHDFRDYPALLRQAISLARRLQDPLLEFSQLCTPDEELLCLKYHPLQEQVNKDVLLTALCLEFINRTNEVGVDVNRCITHSHTANLVQFVCGLGPRKSSALVKTLKQNNSRLENRTQLVTVCHMGPKVFINAAGFIKIDTNSLGDSTEAYVEVLDGSRVHPETYEWARKMAVDALEYDDTAEDANPAGALEEILESPERLKDLDLDAFAEELERQGFGNKSITLYDIRAELNHRYKDLRTPYRSPNSEERFNMLTKESPNTFYVGKLILCRVTGFAHKKPQGEQLDQAKPVRNEETGLWQCPFCLRNTFPDLSEVWNHFDAGSCPGAATGVRCRLDNGCFGFIPTKLISDKRINNPEERVKIGMTVNCRIIKIDIDRFAVDLTCRSADLIDKNNEYRPSKDLYYDVDLEEKDQKIEEEFRKKQARQTYIKRVIVHPSFHNIGFKETEKLMVNMDPGEVIIRPSSKGANRLTVTWKVFENIYQHIDVREEGKENAFSLGQSLYIGNEEFEDLDEIIARHIQPMAAFARDITNFKYFQENENGKKDAIDKYLIDEKRKAPAKIPYVFSASKDYPGKFMLSYLPRNKPRHEYITVTSDGFRYRQQMFPSMNSLLRWFKEHFRDPVGGTPGSISLGRTPLTQSLSLQTPSINLSGVDAQTIQRAVSALPTQMYNTLAQVAGQTPQPWGAAPSNFTGGFTGGYNFQAFATPQQPMATPLLTPSYHGSMLATPSQTLATPRYQPTPQTNWNPPGMATPRSTPSQRQLPPLQQTNLPPTNLPPPNLPQTNLPPLNLPHNLPPTNIPPPNLPPTNIPPPNMSQNNLTQAILSQPGLANVLPAMLSNMLPSVISSMMPVKQAHTAQDWRKAAEMWAKKRQEQQFKGTPRSSPAMRQSPMIRPSPSPMSECTPAGDATPLIDEYEYEDR